jgi:hypothetical protein
MRSVATSVAVLLGLTLMGCSTSTPSAGPADSAGSGESGAAAEPAEVEAPADLAGEWTQRNPNSEDSFQAATNTADAIEVFWVSDGGNTKALYWAGSYDAPSEAGGFSWDSVNDTEKTSGAIMASDAETKTFTFADEVITYEVTAMGVTVTVELERQ